MSEQPQLPPGTTTWGTDMKLLAETEARIDEAVSRTPQAVLEALEPGKIMAAGKELHIFTAQTYLNLARLHSPFVEKKEIEEYAVPDVITALWVMTETDEVVRQTIRLGEEAIERAIGLFATAIPIHQMGGLALTISRHVARSFDPTAQMHPPQQTGGGTPLVSAATATDAAGS